MLWRVVRLASQPTDMTSVEPSGNSDPQPPSPPELVQELARVACLNAERRANPALDAALERLGNWQARRLSETYADLAVQPRFAAAIEFFQTDLYGGTDFTQRDADLARVVPVMMRMLPDGVVATVGKAVELHRISQELDRSLLSRLPRSNAAFSVADYANAYRKMGNRAARERQIRLIGDIGAALDVFVRKPLIHTALVMMRHPARLAGLFALHDFLERGFAAFRQMHGADEFLATIERREWKLMEALFAGAVAPFRDPGIAADAAGARATGIASKSAGA
jgi:hypothetical protein